MGGEFEWLRMEIYGLDIGRMGIRMSYKDI
jgi:hypothetical protein